MAIDKTYEINEWHRLLESIGVEHKPILQNTLPTNSLGFLLEAKIRDCNDRLAHLDSSGSDAELKQKYQRIQLERELADSFLMFVKSLTAEIQQT